MGWNSWNTFGENINEKVVMETADFIVESGLNHIEYLHSLYGSDALFKNGIGYGLIGFDNIAIFFINILDQNRILNCLGRRFGNSAVVLVENKYIKQHKHDCRNSKNKG